jgi:HYDIN/CFA65/VesB-like, Ig-like domain/IPT/TIG domain
MKKLLTTAVIATLTVLVGCSGSSPTPKALPTPSTDAWVISSLTASSSQAIVGETVSLQAAVTKNGSPAPDGTTVTFDWSTGGAYTALASVATSGGTATTGMVAASAGTYYIRARVSGISKSTTVTFRQPDTTTDLQIYNVVPAQGTLDGGDQVTFQGKGIFTPVDLYFSVDGIDYQAQIVSVAEDYSAVTVITPKITGVTDTSRQWVASVRIVRGSGTAYRQELTVPTAYTFLPTSGAPEIYQLFPDHGSPRGGEQVTIFGRNFKAPVTVTFDTGFGSLSADEVSVSEDGRQITVITPQVSADPIQADEQATVTVINEAGTPRATTISKSNAFTFVADQLTPRISTVSPNSGPMAGGTRVSIFGAETSGSGFQFPVQVFFEGGDIGSREADVVSVDVHKIVCVSPDVTNAAVTPPATVDIRVVNVSSGLEETATGAFTYGENLFVSGNTPNQGPATGGTQVTILGSGFAPPLFVDWLGANPPQRLDVLSVTGSEILVSMPGLSPPPCGDTMAGFRVTETDSNQTSEGGNFTYLGESPTVLSVDPNLVTPTANDPSQPILEPADHTLVITGQDFHAPVRVSIGGFVLPDADVTLDSDTQITVTYIPTPDEINLSYNTSSCVDTNGNPGARDIPTNVPVTVTNINGNCSNTLASGLAYEPWDRGNPPDPHLGQCHAAPVLNVNQTALNFPDQTAGGACPSGNTQTFMITNDGTADLNWSIGISGTDASDFTPDITSGTLGANISVTVTMDFCPATTGAKSAQVDVNSNGGSATVTLTGNGT